MGDQIIVRRLCSIRRSSTVQDSAALQDVFRSKRHRDIELRHREEDEEMRGHSFRFDIPESYLMRE